MLLESIRTIERTKLFKSMASIRLHDYVAIALNDGSHIVIKDRYKCETTPNGFEMSVYPYVTPQDFIEEDSLIRLLTKGNYEVYKFNR